MLRNLGIRGQILSALALPIVVLALVCGRLTYLAGSDMHDAQQAQQLALAADSFAGLAGRLATERADSVALLRHRSAVTAKDLTAARLLVDQSLRQTQAQAANGPATAAVQRVLERSATAHARLNSLRQQIDAGTAKAAAIATAYTQVIAADVDVPADLAAAANDRAEAANLVQFGQLGSAVEALAQEQLTGTDVIYAGRATVADQRALGAAQAAQQQAVDEFLREATGQQAGALRQALAANGVGPARPAVARTVAGALTSARAALERAGTTRRPDVSPSAWTAATTAQSAAMGSVLDQVSRDGFSLAADSYQKAHTALLVTLAGALVVILLALLFALAVSRRISDPVRRLTLAATHVRDELPRIVETVAADEELDFELPVVPVVGRNEVSRLAAAFVDVNAVTIEVAREQARLRGAVTDLFVNVARRNHVLLGRQLAFIDQLERNEVNPDALEDLFRLDHLATRMRRNAESLMVLAGVDAGRGQREAMPLSDVVRTANSEIEHYQRVTLSPAVDPPVFAHLALPIAHLLAELLENATTFSDPGSQVVVTAEAAPDGDGVLVTVTDDGLGLTETELAELNARIEELPTAESLSSPRLGFFVVGRLARSLGARVTLGSGPGRGTAAQIELPANLFVPASENADSYDAGEEDEARVAADAVAVAAQTSLLAAFNAAALVESELEPNHPRQLRPESWSIPADGELQDLPASWAAPAPAAASYGVEPRSAGRAEAASGEWDVQYAGSSPVAGAELTGSSLISDFRARGQDPSAPLATPAPAYQPEAYEPGAYESEAFESASFEPEAFEPEAFEPEAFEPEAFEPEAFESASYEPEAFESVSYSPGVYEPEAYETSRSESVSDETSDFGSAIGYQPAAQYESVADHGLSAAYDHQSAEYDHQSVSYDHESLEYDHESAEYDHQSAEYDHQSVSYDHESLEYDHESVGPEALDYASSRYEPTPTVEPEPIVPGLADSPVPGLIGSYGPVDAFGPDEPAYGDAAGYDGDDPDYLPGVGYLAAADYVPDTEYVPDPGYLVADGIVPADPAEVQVAVASGWSSAQPQPQVADREPDFPAAAEAEPAAASGFGPAASATSGEPIAGWRPADPIPADGPSESHATPTPYPPVPAQGGPAENESYGRPESQPESSPESRPESPAAPRIPLALQALTASVDVLPHRTSLRTALLRGRRRAHPKAAEQESAEPASPPAQTWSGQPSVPTPGSEGPDPAGSGSDLLPWLVQNDAAQFDQVQFDQVQFDQAQPRAEEADRTPYPPPLPEAGPPVGGHFTSRYGVERPERRQKPRLEGDARRSSAAAAGRSQLASQALNELSRLSADRPATTPSADRVGRQRRGPGRTAPAADRPTSGREGQAGVRHRSSGEPPEE